MSVGVSVDTLILFSSTNLSSSLCVWSQLAPTSLILIELWADQSRYSDASQLLYTACGEVGKDSLAGGEAKTCGQRLLRPVPIQAVAKDCVKSVMPAPLYCLVGDEVKTCGQRLLRPVCLLADC